MVIVYTAAGGTRAVNWTQSYQMVIVMAGMLVALLVALFRLPEGVGFVEATGVAGTLGRMNAIDLSFDLDNRYNIWSGIIGGCFLQLAYFGTDQSQVQRYLTGKSLTHSRMGLLVNGLVKVPMQFFILFVGAMVFVFYQFQPPPVFFNPVEVEKVRQTEDAGRFAALEGEYRQAFEARRSEVHEVIEARREGDPERRDAAVGRLKEADARMAAIRGDAVGIMKEHNPDWTSDTNYIFLTFVVNYLPAGLVGLLIASILFASMSSTSSEISALASTSVVDLYQRLVKPDAGERHYVRVSKLATVAWGAVAIGFAELFRGRESLVEAVNIVGSLFYGTILGIFLAAFFAPRLTGTAVFAGAVVAELVVLAFHFLTVAGYVDVAYLWYNVIGCAVVFVVAFAAQPFLKSQGAAG
jgi:Na+/proline symporter